MSFMPILAATLAQAAPAAGGTTELIASLLPMVLIMVVFYFLLIRPQQQRMKQHRQMVSELKKGDEVVTSGGFIGKVKSIADNELSVEIAPNVVVRVLRHTITEVRNIQPANDAK